MSAPNSTGPEDEFFARWLDEARAGSMKALGDLLDAFRRVLLHRVQGKIPLELRSKISESDVVQDAMLEAGRDFEKFRGTSREEFLRWIMQIVINNCIDLSRHYGPLGKRGPDAEISLDDPRRANSLGRLLLAREPAPGETAIDREERELYARALDSMPRPYREVIYLRDVRRLSWPEIGEQLGLSADAARKLFSRARKQACFRIRAIEHGETRGHRARDLDAQL